MSSGNNKRILSNTIVMYVRMLLSIIVTLYTSRILLKELGFESFGIYSVIGSIVAMFSFLNITMSTATSRFLSFEIGQNGDVQSVFSTALFVHIVIALIVFVSGLFLGYHFIFEYINIDDSRLTAAKWVYFYSILTVTVVVIQVPFTALIMSHEELRVFSYLDIFGVLLKLFSVFLLSYILYDKLVTYSLLVFVSSMMVFILTVTYVITKFRLNFFAIRCEKILLKKMISFSGWDLYGNASVVAKNQGSHILLNLFFGALANAASGIASLVQGAVLSFAASALAAVRPQIVKSYALGDYKRMNWLVVNSANFTFFVLLILTIPLILELDYVLRLWLGQVPDYTVLFCKYILIMNLFSSLSMALTAGIHASGHVKGTSFVNGTMYLLVIPLAYISYNFNYPIQTVYQLSVFFVFLGVLFNAWLLCKLLPAFKFNEFLKKIAVHCFLSSTIGFFVLNSIQLFPQGFMRLLFTCICSLIFFTAYYLIFVLDEELKIYLKNYLIKRVE